MDNHNNQVAISEEKSYFDGGYFAYIGYSILVGFVSMITLGIAFPWMFCLMQKWQAKHTVICGKRMYFDGTGVQLIGRYILWWFLTVITFGIYGFWLVVAMKKWIAKHTHFEGEEDNNSFFDGGVGGFIGNSILSGLVSAVPIVGLAWGKIIMLNWEINHTVIDSRRLVFTGKVGNLFGKYFLWGFLSIITFGIFGLFVPVKYMRWETERTIDNEHTTEALIEKSEYRTNVHTDASTFKTYAVENEMECVKAGISDNMAEEDLLSLANAQNRAAQYEYALRFAGENYTEDPYSSLLKASAEAQFAPAMSLYATTHALLEENLKEEMLRKAADKGQIAAIKACMAIDAQRGISMPEDKSALPVLKSAVRYADLLIDSGYALTVSEGDFIKSCTLKIRRIICKQKKASSAGAVAGIIAAVIAGVILLVAIIGAVSMFLFKRAEAPAFRNDYGYSDEYDGKGNYIGGDMATAADIAF